MWDWQVIAGLVALVGTPWATLTYVVRRIIRGELVPRTVMVDRMSDKDASIAALEATVAELRKQQAILLGRPSP